MKKSLFPKIKIHRPLLIRTIIYAVLSVVFYYIQYYISTREDYAQIRYLRQAAVALLVISLLLLVIAVRKMIPKGTVIKLLGRLSSALGLSGAITKAYNFLRKVFGLPEYEKLRGGRDEKSFIITNPLRRIIRRRDPEVKQRYKELQTNAQRIRYIYVKYMQRAIKGGFHFSASKTPSEISDAMNLEDKPKRFFDTYCGARYSDGSYPISDSDVESAAHLISKSGKVS